MGKPIDGSKSDGRRTETRDRINHVALDVFIERGYDGSTLREIADRLGVTRPAQIGRASCRERV